MFCRRPAKSTKDPRKCAFAGDSKHKARANRDGRAKARFHARLRRTTPGHTSLSFDQNALRLSGLLLNSLHVRHLLLIKADEVDRVQQQRREPAVGDGVRDHFPRIGE
jgi:hypothetical protein